MRGSLSFMPAVMEMETFSSSCVTLVGLSRGWSSSFSTILFDKSRGNWHGIGHCSQHHRGARRNSFRPRIVTAEARVLRFVYRRRSPATPKPLVFFGIEGKPETITGNIRVLRQRLTPRLTYTKRDRIVLSSPSGMRQVSSAASIELP